MNVASLGIKIDSSDARRASTELDKLTGAGRGAERAVERIGSAGRAAADGLNNVERAAASLNRATKAMSRLVPALGLAEVARQAIQASDAYSGMTARLSLVTDGAGQLALVQKELYDLAQETRAPLGETVDLYSRMARATKDSGVSARDLLKVTEIVNKSLIVSGTTTAQASGALLQLSQGFSAGVIRGEEFNSVLEGAPRIMQAIADGLGKTVGELRVFASEGKLTADVAIGALLSQQGKLNEEFARMPATVGQGLQQVSNAFLALIGQIDKASGATTGLAHALQGLSKFVADPDDFFNDLFPEARLKIFEATIGSIQGRLAELRAQKDENLLPRVLGVGKTLIQDIKEAESALARVIERRDRLARKIGGEADTKGADPLAEGDEQAKRRAAAQRASSVWDGLAKKYQTAAEKHAEVAKQIRETGLAAGKSEAEINKLIAAAAPKAGIGKAAADAVRLRKADLARDLADIQRALRGMSADYRNTESLLEASRAAGLISEREYFDERIRLLNLTSEVEEQALQKEINRRRQEKLTGSEQVENLRHIADAEAELGRRRDDTSAQEKVLLIQQGAALKRNDLAYQQASASAQEYYDILVQGQQRELSAMGAGDQERRRLAGLEQIEDRYQQQLFDLSRTRLAAQTDDQRKQIDDQVALVRSFRDRALSTYDEYWSSVLEKQQDASIGLKEAVSNYLDEANNAALQTQQAFEGAFRGLEDLFVEVVRTGKLNFKSLADSIIADVARMMGRQGMSQLLGMMVGAGGASGPQELGLWTTGLANAKGNAFAPSGLVRFEKGGVVATPTLFRFANGAGFSPGLMGEAGPEAIMPLKRGRDGKLGVQGAGSTVTVTNHIAVGSNDPNEVRRAMKASQQATVAQISDMLVRGQL